MFFFLKYKKSFQSKLFSIFRASKVTSLNIRLEISISGNIRNFWVLRIKVHQVAIIFKKFHRKFLTVFWIYQGSEYGSSSTYAKFLKIPGLCIYLLRNTRKFCYVSVVNIPFIYFFIFRAWGEKYRNIRHFSNIRAEMFHFLKYKNAFFPEI